MRPFGMPDDRMQEMVQTCAVDRDINVSRWKTMKRFSTSVRNASSLPSLAKRMADSRKRTRNRGQACVSVSADHSDRDRLSGEHARPRCTCPDRYGAIGDLERRLQHHDAREASFDFREQLRHRARETHCPPQPHTTASSPAVPDGGSHIGLDVVKTGDEAARPGVDKAVVNISVAAKLFQPSRLKALNPARPRAS